MTLEFADEDKNKNNDADDDDDDDDDCYDNGYKYSRQNCSSK